MKKNHLTDEQQYWARALAELYRRKPGEYSPVHIQGIYEKADKDRAIHDEAIRINNRIGRRKRNNERRW